MSQLFISLVGTQIMGTLQPWLAIVNHATVTESFLLATDKVRPIAEALRRWSIENDLGEATIIDIPDGLCGEDAAPAVVAGLAELGIQKGLRPIFNLDGGLNFMINACVLALEPSHRCWCRPRPTASSPTTPKMRLFYPCPSRNPSLPSPCCAYREWSIERCPRTIEAPANSANVGVSPFRSMRCMTSKSAESTSIWSGAQTTIAFAFSSTTFPHPLIPGNAKIGSEISPIGVPNVIEVDSFMTAPFSFWFRIPSPRNGSCASPKIKSRLLS